MFIENYPDEIDRLSFFEGGAIFLMKTIKFMYMNLLEKMELV